MIKKVNIDKYQSKPILTTATSNRDKPSKKPVPDCKLTHVEIK